MKKSIYYALCIALFACSCVYAANEKRQANDVYYDDGFIESYFLLDSDGYSLNAVYTRSNAKTGPTVILLPGSGVSDYNETVGLLKPFKDIAAGLARRGINSLRLEKRTNRYKNIPVDKLGLEEEYLIDFNNAIKWLNNNGVTKDLYLLGHSLGAQIAPILAKQNNIAGLILFNGSARHLADIMKDQFIALDPANADDYIKYAELAKSVTAKEAENVYYYSASTHYWKSYNKISPVETLKQLKLPVLIINSTADNYCFKDDLNSWGKELSDYPNIKIKLFDDYSHFGYQMDLTNPQALYTPHPFPKPLLATFNFFLKYNH